MCTLREHMVTLSHLQNKHVLILYTTDTEAELFKQVLSEHICIIEIKFAVPCACIIKRSTTPPKALATKVVVRAIKVTETTWQTRKSTLIGSTLIR